MNSFISLQPSLMHSSLHVTQFSHLSQTQFSRFSRSWHKFQFFDIRTITCENCAILTPLWILYPFLSYRTTTHAQNCMIFSCDFSGQSRHPPRMLPQRSVARRWHGYVSPLKWLLQPWQISSPSVLAVPKRSFLIAEASCNWLPLIISYPNAPIYVYTFVWCFGFSWPWLWQLFSQDFRPFIKFLEITRKSW